MKWISTEEKMPPLYKEVLLHFNNGLVCNGYFTDKGPIIDRHIQLKHVCGIDPEDTVVVYWSEKPEYPENIKIEENGD